MTRATLRKMVRNGLDFTGGLLLAFAVWCLLAWNLIGLPVAIAIVVVWLCGWFE